MIVYRLIETEKNLIINIPIPINSIPIIAGKSKFCPYLK